MTAITPTTVPVLLDPDTERGEEGPSDPPPGGRRTGPFWPLVVWLVAVLLLVGLAVAPPPPPAEEVSQPVPEVQSAPHAEVLRDSLLALHPLERRRLQHAWARGSDLEAHRLELEAGLVGDHVGRPRR